MIEAKPPSTPPPPKAHEEFAKNSATSARPNAAPSIEAMQEALLLAAGSGWERLAALDAMSSYWQSSSDEGLNNER